ncbi:hypothetical protein PQX77_015982 [Marasmius sp. AFHP31]|nr:hypothetical protein PQX77_015982 [Marasmius sp. AFHP31]
MALYKFSNVDNLSLPPETTEQTLLLLDPLNVGAVSQALHHLYDLIYSPRRVDPRVQPKAEFREIVDARSDVESHARQANGDAGCETRPITSGDRSRTLHTMLKPVTNVTPFRLSEDLLKEKMSAKWMWVTAEYGKGACLDPILVSDDDDPGKTSLNNLETYLVLSLANRRMNRCRWRTTMPPHPHSHLRTTSYSDIELEFHALLHTYLTPYDRTE